MAFRTRIRVRFGDEDHAQIVYYPRFFHFFHCAFEDFFDQQGLPYRECLDVDRIGWPAVHAEADYEKPARFGENLDVEVRVSRIGEKSATFEYDVRDVAGARVCRGRVVVACIDMDTYAARPIAEKHRALFALHLEPSAS
jgi:4-hydroxybenzoyl-CoA thioesterase